MHADDTDISIDVSLNDYSSIDSLGQCIKLIRSWKTSISSSWMKTKLKSLFLVLRKKDKPARAFTVCHWKGEINLETSVLSPFQTWLPVISNRIRLLPSEKHHMNQTPEVKTWSTETCTCIYHEQAGVLQSTVHRSVSDCNQTAAADLESCCQCYNKSSAPNPGSLFPPLATRFRESQLQNSTSCL